LRIVGIDPGLEGAVATIWENGEVTISPMPIEFGEIDSRGLYVLLKTANPELVVVEKLHGMPHFGANNFKFGGSYYAAVYCCQILQIPMERVSPQRWKANVLAGTDKSKQAAIKWAKGAYPKANLIAPGKRVASHDYAEALALAEFGLRMKGGLT